VRDVSSRIGLASMRLQGQAGAVDPTAFERELAKFQKELAEF